MKKVHVFDSQEQVFSRIPGVDIDHLMLIILFRRMSGVHFELPDALRQTLTGITPENLCSFLGGARVINKVIMHFFQSISFK